MIRQDEKSTSGWRKAAGWLIILGASSLFVGCGPSHRHIQFREEIQLAGGQMLTVDRALDVKMFGEVGGPGGWEPTFVSLAVTDPRRPDDPPKWESTGGVLPVLLDRAPEDAQWTVLATFGTCESWSRFGRPKNPYAEFRVRNGQWQRVDFSHAWIGRKANVFTGMRASGEPVLLTIAQKKKRADPRDARWYDQIEEHWLSGC